MAGATWRSRLVRSWRHALSIPLLAAGPLLVLAAQAPAGMPVQVMLAGHATAADEACPALSPADAGRAAAARPGAAGRLSLIDELDELGQLRGHRLRLVTAAGHTTNVELPVEAALAAPAGALLVYTVAPDDAPSQVRGLDTRTGCDNLLATLPEVIRSAVVDDAGKAVYVHRVTRSARADLGVTRVDLATGSATLALAAPRPAADVGPTFGTELHWSTNGGALLVQSCGFSACRSRVLDTSSGRVATYDRPGQGQYIGLTARHLVTYADCAGLPCDVMSAALDGSAVSTLASDAISAELERDRGGRDIVRIDTGTGTMEVDQ